MKTPIRQPFSHTDIVFLSHILKISKSSLYLNSIVLDVNQKKQFQKYRRLFTKSYPIDYIIGKIELSGLTFNLNKNVLIPRPETEILIKYISDNAEYTDLLLDVGTGSGLIGITLSNKFYQVILADISQKALNIAKKNILENKIKNILTTRSNLLQSNSLQKTILNKVNWTLVANLPYIPSREIKYAKKYNVFYEPSLALYSGKDGLDCFRELINQIKVYKNKPKQCFFELDPRNIHQAKQIIETIGYNCKIIKDENDFDRFLIGEIIE
ncbi:MAG: peptide chain release factor N(5)-glutamine methyltransferase [candidate division SR1 bacterium]|nr:peptide chain release factor N(5)-glutamine methyltransferase [candidate division SR1 bacterium]